MTSALGEGEFVPDLDKPSTAEIQNLDTLRGAGFLGRYDLATAADRQMTPGNDNLAMVFC